MDIYIYTHTSTYIQDAAYGHAERRVVPVSWTIFAVVK